MVRILHTADVHLDPDAPERRDALEAVLEVADAEDVDLVTLGGDTFESDRAAERLRPDLRELFRDRDYDVLAIPGNHDPEAFEGNVAFGDAFVPATEEPFGEYAIGDTRVTTLPYTPRATDELMVGLQGREPHEGPEVLVLHCSLEAPMAGTTGEGEDVRYFPVTANELDELGFEYYLAGHYHDRQRRPLSNGGTFVYPGTPASTTRAETGPRACVLVDTGADRPVEFRELETFHHDELELRVTPGREEQVLATIEDQVDTWRGRTVEARIAVDGFTERDEAAFAADLEAASEGVEVTNRTRAVERILRHRLFERFKERLAAREGLQATENEWDDPEAVREEVRETTLAVFAELEAEGTL